MVENTIIEVKNLGLIAYKEALAIQEAHYQTIVDRKKKNSTLPQDEQEPTPNYLLCCEHFPVYTLGRSSSIDHLLVDNAVLQAQGIALYNVNRGGDITYHGPGQLVIYPIIDLEFFFKDIHRYLRLLESSVIETLRNFNIVSTQLPGFTGVWLNEDKNKQCAERKICAIGIRVSRWVTMHGLALNVCNDLMPFSQIIPCGIAKQVTSIQQELKKTIPMRSVEDMLTKSIINNLLGNT
ncbi:lipoyl(octanoyl) transferase LipB [Cardinium endosymbiont of Culicoides punctatus]|uniref:lipoyl(octanoyl) transferase LipB n=1 Tax=Cardinium endosymbiont of Culicoides punctatus TaxID=2304601 RepID=UPI001058502A|nr:lipoyl(octanoyl) transferase LipB [Cardinium endosymbiont of Culicoides punctatus]TDG93361.1 Octanoyltransferase [Cardinium endosymbiont of Culicoides punctatus]